MVEQHSLIKIKYPWKRIHHFLISSLVWAFRNSRYSVTTCNIKRKVKIGQSETLLCYCLSVLCATIQNASLVRFAINMKLIHLRILCGHPPEQPGEGEEEILAVSSLDQNNCQSCWKFRFCLKFMETSHFKDCPLWSLGLLWLTQGKWAFIFCYQDSIPRKAETKLKKIWNHYTQRQQKPEKDLSNCDIKFQQICYLIMCFFKTCTNMESKGKKKGRHLKVNFK